MRNVFIRSFLVCIFPLPDWMPKDTPYLSVFSPNAGKYGPEKLRIRTLFTQCLSLTLNISLIEYWAVTSKLINTNHILVKFHMSATICVATATKNFDWMKFINVRLNFVTFSIRNDATATIIQSYTSFQFYPIISDSFENVSRNNIKPLIYECKILFRHFP